MFMARPAAEIEPQLLMFSSSRILPGPIRPSASRSIRTLSDGSAVGDDLRMVSELVLCKRSGGPDPAGIIAVRPGRAASIAAARVDLNVLSGRIFIIAIALSQIVAGTRGRLRACDRADGAAGNRAHGGANRPTGDQAAEQTADHRAANGACGRIRRWRRRRRCVSHGRRIACAWRRATGIVRDIGVGIVRHLDIGNVARRTIHLLRVEVPDAADIPPPTHAAIVHLMPPAAAFPCEPAVIGVTAEIARREIAANDALTLRPADLRRPTRARSHYLTLTLTPRGGHGLALPLRRLVLLLGLR